MQLSEQDMQALEDVADSKLFAIAAIKNTAIIGMGIVDQAEARVAIEVMTAAGAQVETGAIKVAEAPVTVAAIMDIMTMAGHN